MRDYTLGEMERQFAKIIWNKSPIASGELVEICAEKLNWKKSTTYTMLRRLCQKGIFRNDSGIVCTVMTEKEFLSVESSYFVDRIFDGSLPAFISAFSSKRGLSKEDAEKLHELIDKYENKRSK